MFESHYQLHRKNPVFSTDTGLFLWQNRLRTDSVFHQPCKMCIRTVILIELPSVISNVKMRGICRNPAFPHIFCFDIQIVSRSLGFRAAVFLGSFPGLGSLEFRSLLGGISFNLPGFCYIGLRNYILRLVYSLQYLEALRFFFSVLFLYPL